MTRHPYPSRPLQSSPALVLGRGGETLWESPRHPWPVPGSEAWRWDTRRSERGTARRRALEKARRVRRAEVKEENDGGGASALTAVVEDELLEAGELGAGGDVETAAIQLPDLVMLHIQAFGVVVVQH